MRQVEFTEQVKLGTETYYEGDRKSFDEAEAAEYIRLGWAKCVQTGEQGERVPGAQKLNVQPVKQKIAKAK